jgi:hypothetical protein
MDVLLLGIVLAVAMIAAAVHIPVRLGLLALFVIGFVAVLLTAPVVLLVGLSRVLGRS